ncbi:MAG TPA: ABC transporter ATP-binding protein [Acidimicrobiales bacterium]|jgi:iron complex transport system ATP-binding protein|nr:ABC transporter ATP-binding protein [Acidimicrobiales bacterium]
MEAISCRSLRVSFGTTEVLRGVSLEVPKGGWTTVVGPNGSGKTTLLRTIAGLQASQGLIQIDGHSLGAYSRREIAKQIAIVPQQPVIPHGMKALDYVLLGRTSHLGFFETEKRQDIEKARAALDELDVRFAESRTMGTLSGGEIQRVVVARALTQGSPVLLLDEPTTALDIGHQQEMLEAVDGLRRRLNLTVLATMHDLTLAGQYADALILLERGEVVASGTPQEVLTEEQITQHYGASIKVIDDGFGPIVTPVRRGTNSPE